MIKNILRLRPSTGLGLVSFVFNEYENSIEAAKELKSIRKKIKRKKYYFEHIAHDENQEQFFKQYIIELVELFLKGENVTILAHGPRGSGKTYTLLGNHLNQEERGIIYRTLGHIFEKISPKSLTISFIEIYGERVFDLLNDSLEAKVQKILSPPNSPVQGEKINSFQIRERGILKGVKKKTIKDLKQAYHFVNKGKKCRLTQTQKDKDDQKLTSDRSHAILEISYKGKTFRIVDLAAKDELGTGEFSEKGRKTLPQASFKKVRSPKEGLDVRKSVGFLEHAIKQLCSDGIVDSNRSTLLTNLLRTIFKGSQKENLALVFCLRQEKEHIKFTIPILRLSAKIEHYLQTGSEKLESSKSLQNLRIERDEFGCLVTKYFNQKEFTKKDEELIFEEMKAATEKEINFEFMKMLKEAVYKDLTKTNEILFGGIHPQTFYQIPEEEEVKNAEDTIQPLNQEQSRFSEVELNEFGQPEDRLNNIEKAILERNKQIREIRTEIRNLKKNIPKGENCTPNELGNPVGGLEVISQEQFEAQKQLSSCKTRYRILFAESERLKEMRKVIKGIAKSIG
eukprot:snap_masked-scaffold_2-processed-gene-12.30-mRNA-1 protein AED:0.80 eAED:0.85 QI:0/0/0/1/1/1/2/0/566